MVELQHRRENRLPDVYRPVFGSGWVQSLELASREAFKEQVSIHTEDLRLQLLRPSEIKPILDLGSTAVANLRNALVQSMPAVSWLRLKASVEGFHLPIRDPSAPRILLVKFNKNEALLEQREGIRKIVELETGIEIIPTDDYFLDFIIGHIPSNPGLSDEAIRAKLDSKVPKKLVVGQSEVNDPKQLD